MADSRMDLILKKLNGEDVELVPPMSRIEKIYFKLLGYDIELDPPQSRSEVLLTEYVNNGGGGGGLSTYTITLISAPVPQYPDAPVSVNYFISCFDENYTYYGGGVKTNEGYIGEYQTEVWSSASQDIEVIIFPSNGIRVMDSNDSQPISVTGDAEIIHNEDEGYWNVYVTGNCTITYQGSR